MSEIDDTAAALRSATARLTRRLRAEGGASDFTPSQVAVLRRLLESGAATTSELARAEGVRPQSMSATIASLEAAEIIGRRPDPSDGRATQVFLTPDAERDILDHRAAKQEWLTSVIGARLTPAEQRILADAAALIERLLAP